MNATSVATPALPTADPAAPGRLHGWAWLSWRQHWLLIGTALALLVVIGAVLLWQRGIILHDTAVLRAHGCTPGHAFGSGCGAAMDYVMAHPGRFSSLCQPVLAAVPLLIGMFVGAPLLAQEYENGTTRLAWSQSISRLSWLRARLTVPLVVVLVGSTVLTLLTHWIYWESETPTMQQFYDNSPFQNTTYATIGPVAVAAALCALALGAALGTLLRRTLPAVGLTGLLLLLGDFALRLVRPYLWTLDCLVQHQPPGGYPLNSLLVSDGVVLANGVKMSRAACGNSPRVCESADTVYGYYQPVSHLWPIQLVETGILLALTLALFALVVHRVRRGPA